MPKRSKSPMKLAGRAVMHNTGGAVVEGEAKRGRVGQMAVKHNDN